MIYPRINEEEKEIVVHQPSGEQLTKLVGKKHDEKYVYKPTTDTLLSIGKRYKRNTPITWELISALNKKSRLKPLLIEFIIERLKNRDNIILKITDVYNKLSKEGEINDLPKIENLTFGDFWDKRMLEYKRNPYIINSKVSKSSPKKSKEEEVEKEIIISEDVYNFFKKNNKTQQLEDFRNSIPKGQIVGPINALFDFIHELVTSDEKVKIKTPRITNLKREELNSADKNKMKKDILNFISAYKNVNQFAEDTKTYKNEITETNRKSFLKLLHRIEASGVGRGETLIAYCVQNANFAGGVEPFDIKEKNGKTYEVKDYAKLEDTSNSIDPIRLGTHGKLTRFEFWGIINHTISLAQEIYDKFENNELKDILGDYFYNVWKNVISDNKNNMFAVSSGFESGEINSKKLLTLKLWYNLAHELTLKDFTSDEEEKYTLAILKGSGVQSKSIAIEPLDPESVSDGDNIDVISDGDLNSIMRKLKSIKYVKHPDQFQKDLDDVAKKYFEENQEIDCFLIFRPFEINISYSSDFIFSTISQAAVKIIEKKYVKRNDNTLNAYKKFKEEIEKAKQDADKHQEDAIQNILKYISYEDFITDEVMNETFNNFYPRIL